MRATRARPVSGSPATRWWQSGGFGSLGSQHDVVHRLAAFTQDPAGGNPAGVALLGIAARRRARLAELDYDFERLRSIMIEAELTTLQLWREAVLRYHARAPFPVGGVAEDPATGAAAAAFAAYLRHLGVVVAPCIVTILQGADMGRPSALLVELIPSQDSVRVSGHAVPMV